MDDYSRNVTDAQFSLIVCGQELDFEEISAKIGLMPNKTVHKGELLNNLPRIMAQEDAWYHTIQLSTPEERDPALTGMLDTILAAKEFLQKCIDSGDTVTLRLYVHSAKALMGYRLTPATICSLQQIGLPLDVTSVSWGDVGL